MGYRLDPLAFLVSIEPGSGGSDPQTPRRLGECPPPNPPSKHRLFETVGWSYGRFVGLWDAGGLLPPFQGCGVTLAPAPFQGEGGGGVNQPRT